MEGLKPRSIWDVGIAAEALAPPFPSNNILTANPDTYSSRSFSSYKTKQKPLYLWNNDSLNHSCSSPWQALKVAVISSSEFDYSNYMSGIIEYLSFCDCLVSLCIMFCSPCQLVFLLLNNISLCTPLCLSIHGRLGCFCLSVLWIVLLWREVCKHSFLFKALFPILLCIYSHMELLDHMEGYVQCF